MLAFLVVDDVEVTVGGICPGSQLDILGTVKLNRPMPCCVGDRIHTISHTYYIHTIVAEECLVQFGDIPFRL